MEKKFEQIVGAPAAALEYTVDLVQRVDEKISEQKYVKQGKAYWASLGPGLTTGASDDDPSGIATYSQTGAQYGFQLLWLALFTFPLMAVVQEMCARIGLVTGRGLAGNIRMYFPRWVLYSCTILLFVANTLNIGADLGAMAKATQLLAPDMNFAVLLMLFTLFTLGLQIFTDYKTYAKYLKWLAFILFSYVLTAAMLHLDLQELLRNTVFPSIQFSKDQLILICAILGTTISPYLFFWQTSQEVEEEILHGKVTLKQRQGTTKEELKNMRVDVWSGMFISNVVMFFIIATCAATLYAHGITHIDTAADAAQALRPLAGEYAYLLFTVGIIGTGLLAVPVLAGAVSYALSESFGWHNGLYRKLKEANAFYGIIIISTVIGFGLNFIGLDPIKTLLYSAIVNGLIAPVILVLIVLMSSNEKIMGSEANHPFVSVIGWSITTLMTLAGIATLYSLFV